MIVSHEAKCEDNHYFHEFNQVNYRNVPEEYILTMERFLRTP